MISNLNERNNIYYGEEDLYLNNLNIEFENKELSLGDKIVLHECITERATIFSITNDEKTSCALQLNWK